MRWRRATLRRVVVLAVPALLVLAVAVLVGMRVLRAAEPDALQDRPGTVLLVPGFGGGTAALEPIAGALQRAGRQVSVVTLPDGGTGDLEDQADALDRAVDAAMGAGASSVDVVGYSAGGVVARLWVADHDGRTRARRVVSLASPQHGTTVASLAALVTGSACPLACRQLVTGSPLLARLNASDETPDGPRWTSVWSADDEVVTPPSSARLDGATNVELQQVCAGTHADHDFVPRAPLTVGLVLAALGPGLPSPAATDCRRLTAAGAAVLGE